MKMGVCREWRRTLRLRHSPAPMQKNVSRGGELRPLQQPTKRMKTRRPPYLSKHLVMSTGNLGEAQSVTSRLWSKHRSRVAGNKGYSANLSRCPLGRSWLCYIDCRAPMHVEPEGSMTKCFVYLPLAGSMKISAQGGRFSVRPGGSFFLPAATAHVFDATPIRCVMLEIPATKLRADLASLGWTGQEWAATAWAPDSPAARSIAGAIIFALEELDRGCGDQGIYPRRLEALVLASLAKEIVARFAGSPEGEARIGKATVQEVKDWIDDRVRSGFKMAELSAFTGLKTRALHQQFLRAIHTTPIRYVQDQRLEAARRKLRDTRHRDSVSKVAADFSFHHHGRFASAYRRKFGESPSVTQRDALRRYPQTARE